jgi:predicted nucleotide-binding protein (sugar kinase/HSP70/actin superfamily)
MYLVCFNKNLKDSYFLYNAKNGSIIDLVTEEKTHPNLSGPNDYMVFTSYNYVSDTQIYKFLNKFGFIATTTVLDNKNYVNSPLFVDGYKIQSNSISSSVMSLNDVYPEMNNIYFKIRSFDDKIASYKQYSSLNFKTIF